MESSQKSLAPKFKHRSFGGGKGGPNRRLKNLECHLEVEPNKLDNVSNVEPYHAEKIGPHN